MEISRLTLAVRLPATYIQPLQELQTTIRRKSMVDVRWVSPTEFFLPLIQLGEQPVFALTKLDPAIEGALAECKPFALKPLGVTGLPNLVQPRYACLAIGSEEQSLERFHNKLIAAVSSQIQLGDARQFNPFVTLGRLRQESEQTRVSLGRGLKLTPMPMLTDFPLHEIQMLKSTAAEGVSYETLRSYALRGT